LRLYDGAIAEFDPERAEEAQPENIPNDWADAQDTKRT